MYTYFEPNGSVFGGKESSKFWCDCHNVSLFGFAAIRDASAGFAAFFCYLCAGERGNDELL